MKIELNEPFAPDRYLDKRDTRQMQKALNWLGYYVPYEQVGMIGLPDMAVFTALKKFQEDHGLPATGVARPDDATLAVLNKTVSEKLKGNKL